MAKVLSLLVFLGASLCAEEFYSDRPLFQARPHPGLSLTSPNPELQYNLRSFQEAILQNAAQIAGLYGRDHVIYCNGRGGEETGEVLRAMGYQVRFIQVSRDNRNGPNMGNYLNQTVGADIAAGRKVLILDEGYSG